MDAKRQAEDPNRAAMCRALILMPPPQPPSYPPQLTISERRLRMQIEWDLIEAANEAKKSGLEVSK
jgi:hypothetical protein